MKTYWNYIKTFARNCFSYIWNKQFLTFLSFFFLSFVFWVFFTLNETYEQDFSIPLEVRGKPENVVLTQDPPKEIVVTIRDRGSKLLQYTYGSDFAPVQINFKDYANSQGVVRVPINDLRRQIESQISRRSTIVRIRPETVEYMYNYGESKLVPVVLDGVKALPAKGYVITDQRPNTKQVRIFAQKNILDTISSVSVRPAFFKDIKGRQQYKVELTPMRGVKMVPDTLTYTVTSDIISEKTVQVKVQGVNFPATKMLRTFPGLVSITFKAPSSIYNDITADNFALVLDYESLLAAKSNKVLLNLKSLPRGVISAVIYPQDVQFLIEQIPESDEED